MTNLRGLRVESGVMNTQRGNRMFNGVTHILALQVKATQVAYERKFMGRGICLVKIANLLLPYTVVIAGKNPAFPPTLIRTRINLTTRERGKVK